MSVGVRGVHFRVAQCADMARILLSVSANPTLERETLARVRGGGTGRYEDFCYGETIRTVVSTGGAGELEKPRNHRCPNC